MKGTKGQVEVYISGLPTYSPGSSWLRGTREQKNRKMPRGTGGLEGPEELEETEAFQELKESEGAEEPEELEEPEDQSHSN